MKFIPKYQAGGEMPDEAPMDQGADMEQGAPEQGGGQDPIMMIAQAAQQALQSQDCQMAMQVCQAFLQLVQQMAQGGGGEAPQGEEPVYAKRGGKLVRKIR